MLQKHTRGGQEFFDEDLWIPIPDYMGDWGAAMSLLTWLRTHLDEERRVQFFQCLSRNCFLKLSSSKLAPEELMLLNSCSYELLWIEPEDIGAAAHEALSGWLEGNTITPSELRHENLSPLDGPML